MWLSASRICTKTITPGNIPEAQHVDIAPQDLTSSKLDVDQRICSAWPKLKPVAVAVTAKQRKWGKLKSGLFGLVKVTPQKPKKKTAISQKSPILNQGGGLKKQNKQTTNISGVKAWIASEPDTNFGITGSGKVQRKVKR